VCREIFVDAKDDALAIHVFRQILPRRSEIDPAFFVQRKSSLWTF